MTFRILHSADWQIGKQFSSFPGELASLLRDARLSAISKLADLARTGGAKHLLVAGDIYDSEVLAPLTLRQPLERMRHHADLTWHLLPGNHDPARTGGLWDGLVHAGLPGNVKLHGAREVCRLSEGVFLLPAPLSSRATSADPTAWMDEAVTENGIRIGLAHGSVHDFSDRESTNAPISASRAKSAKLSYLALGDWHGTQRIDKRTWYSGTPEPDRWRDNDAGNALLVEFAGPGAIPAVTALRSAHYIWEVQRQLIASDADIAELERRIVGDDPLPERRLVRLTLEGLVSLDQNRRLDAVLSRAADAIRHLSPDRGRLVVEADSADLNLLEDNAELAHAAHWLQAIANDEGDARRAAAISALARLVSWAGQPGGQSETSAR